MSVTWTQAADYEDIRYELSGDGIAKITIDRPQVHNAFRPQTIIEISQALERAREDTSVGVIVLTGEGELAFCSGGDQNVRGDTGYLTEPGKPDAVGRFHVTDWWAVIFNPSFPYRLAHMATAAHLVLNPSTGELVYSLAGHPPPVLRRANTSMRIRASGWRRWPNSTRRACRRVCWWRR